MIYFVERADGLIKIGKAKDYRRRVGQLQSEYGRLKIRGLVEGDYSEERKLHRQFANLRIIGEWFRADESLLHFIAEHGQRITYTQVQYHNAPNRKPQPLQNPVTQADEIDALKKELQTAKDEICRWQGMMDGMDFYVELLKKDIDRGISIIAQLKIILDKNDVQYNMDEILKKSLQLADEKPVKKRNTDYRSMAKAA